MVEEGRREGKEGSTIMSGGGQSSGSRKSDEENMNYRT